MKTKGRFYGCERAGFPPVNNYDYATNIPVRGPGNLEFRWEEVFAESVYMFVESTTNGNFEDNTFVSDFSIASPTEVNYITTTGSNTGSYSSWILSGSSNVYIGISGLFVTSGDLVGLNSGFYAHPIDGNEAIGMYVEPSGSSNPCIYSDLISSGSEDGIIINNRHQHYLSLKINYGEEARIKSYIRGYSSGTIVGYYDPHNNSWELTPPTGYFTFSGYKYHELIYDFETADFPTVTPSEFDVYVESINTGSFITVDSIHVDAYMKKNAFLDFIVPSGYLIQITPDLGWHNILEMFDTTNTETNNPHLITIGPYSLENANLVDNLDNSLSALVDESDINKVVREGYLKYLWRVLPLSPNGQVLTSSIEKTYPQRFDFVKKIEKEDFEIISIDTDSNSNTHHIIGRKPKNSIILVDDQENSSIVYDSNTSWKYSLVLDVPSKTIKLQAKHDNGALSSFIKIKLENQLQEQEYVPLWNVFDDHGVLFDIDRLEKESNHDYSLRLLDYNRNLAGSSFEGIVNGTSRELSLVKEPDALVFSINKTENNTFYLDSLEVVVTAHSIRIHTVDMVKTERLLIDPIHDTIFLTDTPKEYPEQVIIDDSYSIKLSRITDSELFDDAVILNEIKLHLDRSAKLATITYPYYKEFLFKDYKTLFDLKEAIDSISSSGGDKLFKVNISEKLSGNENTLGLFISSNILLPNETLSIAWSPIYLKRISDRGYRNYFLVDTDDLRETSYYSFVKEMKDQIKLFWGSVETDRSVWDPVDSTELSMDSIPTLFDPKISNFVSKDSDLEKRIEAINMWAYNYLGYSDEAVRDRGLKYYLFHPGIGSNSDLKPGIATEFSYIKSSSYIVPNIGPVRNTQNNTVYFSGEV